MNIIIDKKLFPVVFAMLCCVFFATTNARATVLIETDLDYLTTKADLIFSGTVISVDSQWDDSYSKIWTYVAFSVKDIIKGTLDDGEITIKLPGGTVAAENKQMKVDGVPEFKAGDEAVIFYSNDPKRMCPIIGWYQGSIKMHFDEAIGERVVEGKEADKILLRRQSAPSSLGEKTDTGVTYGQFKDEIERIMEQTGVSE